MSTELVMIFAIAVESGLIVWSARVSVFALRGRVIAMNMILIALFAPLLMEIGGHVSNIGNVFYAAAVAGQCVILERYGVAAAHRSVTMIYGTVVALFLLVWTVLRFPVVDGDEYMAAAHLLLARSPDVLVASFAAFALGQGVLIRVWETVRPRAPFAVAALLASCACQAVDTPVFFIAAFWRTHAVSWIADAMAVGFLLKCGLAVALMPAVLVAVMCGRRGRVVTLG